MKDTLRNYFNTFFHTIADFFSIGEKIVIPWVLAQFKDKELLEIGAKLTYYYFAIILFFFWWKIPFLFFRPLNEIGDFLAGVFGPIAFGWLIIGYLMQNKELKNSVEQTGEAQRLAREQLKFQIRVKEDDERNNKNRAQPFFKKLEVNGELPCIEISFINLGGPVHSMLVQGDLKNKESGEVIRAASTVFNGYWGSGEEKKLNFDLSSIKSEEDEQSSNVRSYRFWVCYIDAEANYIETILTISIYPRLGEKQVLAAFENTLDIKEYRYGNHSS